MMNSQKQSLSWLKTNVTIETSHIRVGGLTIEVVRKDIKNMHLAVYPPKGKVRVAVPLRISDEAVRLAVVTKLGWIKRRQEKFKAQPRQTQREYVTGESHYFMGRRYRLRVVSKDGRSDIVVRNKTIIEMTVPVKSSRAKREQMLQNWYRSHLKALIPDIIKKWEKKMGVSVSDWGVKRMKTKWGTCNTGARRIWINLELAKRSPQCLEYIIVHEMVHLVERHHNDRFTKLMKAYLPQWNLLRDELNKSPLASEHWQY